MALPATDSFTGTEGDTLTVYSSNWTNNNGTFSITSSEEAHPSSEGDECGTHWNADTFANDQYAQITVSDQSTDTTLMGCGVRHHASANTFYGAYADTTTINIFKVVSGTWTQLGAAFSISVSTGDIFKLEVVSTTLELFLDTGGGFSSQGTRSDSAISSGSGGVTGFNTEVEANASDWEAGDIGGGASVPTGNIHGCLGGPMSGVI